MKWIEQVARGDFRLHPAQKRFFEAETKGFHLVMGGTPYAKLPRRIRRRTDAD